MMLMSLRVSRVKLPRKISSTRPTGSAARAASSLIESPVSPSKTLTRSPNRDRNTTLFLTPTPLVPLKGPQVTAGLPSERPPMRIAASHHNVRSATPIGNGLGRDGPILFKRIP